MDILLNEDDMRAAKAKAWRRYGKGEGRSLRDLQDEELSRAQVGKVWEWIDSQNMNTDEDFEKDRLHPAMKYVVAQVSKGDWWIDGADVQALKQAAGAE